MSDKTINDFFSIDLFHELFVNYLSDRIGFLRLVHPNWKNTIDDLNLPKESFLGFLIESDKLIVYAVDNNIKINQRALINNVKNIWFHPKRLFESPFDHFTPKLAYYYLYYQRGEYGIKLMEHLLSLPETKNLLIQNEHWFKLFNVLLLASDDILFEWFLKHCFELFNINLNKKDLEGRPGSLRVGGRVIYDQSLNKRIVRTLTKFPHMKDLDFYECLFRNQFVITMDQIQTLLHQSELFSVRFFQNNFFRFPLFGDPKGWQKNEFVNALISQNLNLVETLMDEFLKLFPTFDPSSLWLDNILGFCIATQWVQGTEYFLKFPKPYYFEFWASADVEIKPLSKQFWFFIKPRLSDIDLHNLLEFFAIKSDLPDELIREYVDLSNQYEWYSTCLPFNIILKIIEYEQQSSSNYLFVTNQQLIERLEKDVSDQNLLNECKVLVAAISATINFHKKKILSPFHDASHIETFFTVLLSTNFPESLNHKIRNDTVCIFLKLFDVKEKSILLLLQRYEKVNNQSCLPILMPFMKIERTQFCQLINDVTEDLLDLLWNYFDNDFDDEMILQLFEYNNIRHSTITWFRRHDMMPTTCVVLENILMFYIIQNDVVKFFQDYERELSLCDQPLFLMNPDIKNLPLSPQIMKCLKDSPHVSTSLLS